MPPPTVYLETFGCQMNELDSELVAGRLRSLGYGFTADPGRAGVVLYNTCSVREHAEQKVWSRLGELAARKQREPALVVGVLGCLAERDGVDLVRRMPVVDVLCGPGELDKLPDLLDNAVRTRMALTEERDGEAERRRDGELVSARQVALQGGASRRSSTLAAAEDTLELLDLSRAVSPVEGGSRSAYVRITRGCNKFCTYCVVPFTRGAEVHRPPDHIVEECRRLADAGMVEVTLLGQTVNHYRFEHGAAVTLGGVTQPQKGRSYAGGHRRDPFAGERVTTFAGLLARIHEEVPGIRRLRFVTSYPRDFGDDVLEAIREHPRICRYLHVPAQSGSNRLLKMMNRGYEAGEYVEFLDRARAHLHQPEIGRPLMVSGDFIVGFPTETDGDFAASVRLLERARYKNAFIFKYSPRPGTPAFDKLPDDVPEAVKRRRNNELLALQGRISEGVGREQVGLTFDVLVEGLSRRSLRAGGMSKSDLRKAGAVTLTVNGGTGFRPVENPEHRPEAGDTVQLTARTDGDLIVFLEVPPETADTLVGRIVPVRVMSADRLSLHAGLL
ncbi:MAG: radical SAM protein [Phycisphaerales bacterium]|nr:radical SAM protein [Phycisphaerales bacterium]